MNVRGLLRLEQNHNEKLLFIAVNIMTFGLT